jgi:hypothetical protein
MVAQPLRRVLCLAAGMAALILLMSLGLALTGCKFADTKKVAAVPKSCPDGAELKGAPPPDGAEIWCEKDVGGVPVKDGAFVAYHLGGTRMIEGNYHEGKQSGEWTMWYASGQRESIDHYTDGVRNGIHTSWYRNGSKAIEGEYRDDKREGVWHRWDPNGFKEWTDVYKDDEKISGDVSDGPKTKIP